MAMPTALVPPVDRQSLQADVRSEKSRASAKMFVMDDRLAFLNAGAAFLSRYRQIQIAERACFRRQTMQLVEETGPVPMWMDVVPDARSGSRRPDQCATLRLCIAS